MTASTIGFRAVLGLDFCPFRSPDYNELREVAMKIPHQEPLDSGLAVFTLTAASYAQWSNPADDVPAYHPSAPLKVSALPPILSGSKLTGENFRYPWQVHVYQQVAKIASVVYQLPCNCRCDRALGHTSLRSCFEDCTVPSAPPAPRKASTPMRRPSWARRPPRSAPASPATTTRASTSTSSRQSSDRRCTDSPAIGPLAFNADPVLEDLGPIPPPSQ